MQGGTHFFSGIVRLKALRDILRRKPVARHIVTIWKSSYLSPIIEHSSHIERRTASQHFSLRSMKDLYIREKGVPDLPHRHDYYTIVCIQRAQGKHWIDYIAYTTGANEVHFVSPGQVHQMVLEAMPVGWVMTFSREFLIQNHIPERFLTNINLFRSFGSTPPLQIDAKTFPSLLLLIEEMRMWMIEKKTYRQRALGALLQLFLIHCHNSQDFDRNQLDEKDTQVCLVRDFKLLVDEKYQHWHQVKEYAQETHLTPKHLSETVKKYTGRSAKEFIQDRILLEAKRMLWHTQESIKEIAFSLGFKEPVHFSAFFKRQAGIAPGEFRAQLVSTKSHP